jgi:hypothetical protein
MSTCCSMCVLLLYLLFYVCIVFVFVVLLDVCVAGFTADAELLARSQYSEGPATGHLDTGSSWFPCVYKQMLRELPRFQVATICFSCSFPDLNLNLSVCFSCSFPDLNLHLSLTSFIFGLHVK